ncbi:hypothetical protein A2697_04945 [Candidatus Curtissbacteria bacterium RIFCSPHIGHO2_01_FULL_41_44]|uniref:Uncharacterized protein n=1 Tax=Candidatus Curtissbacteria bacterium RIFCSPLOWO2_01_FULL_42_50 TaxID=1797730 RepID=A0A1F5H6A2_9BACT|nr:MAG: hypothetical protein A3C33_00395 [Candidatus Curtissbacteria bacterium RIFCSPHIGHO2_02_FULL_42_58]OGD93991.1 MAG: hypothetical protein A2697_04945 [Candidatus Curtissbacteria bacterium RIFCSPHIGHO2_01_FULL_41_44]OGD97597.1 MAG: hypothetical protein A3E71_05250 [Candidatus Curtissbacteria bacterium RIFCSPHIGHO2_12_FULL_42_33]OGD99589.1 MAG: hypothetical protein A3B54_02455 [Candidatus Curtissbacteria bacterium RIFCSPLOWO2_01_FULL_42_50]OGE02569.1 MAG: hypothetical protein A3G16_03505 [Ca
MNQLAFTIDKTIFPPARFETFGALASDIILILTSIAGAIAIIFIIISGIKIVTASGDQKKLAAAQATLTYAIIGLTVTILAFVILQVVQYFLRSSVPIT